ncbi:efflux RND transporter permease subunit [Candidatus Saccharibacteria bacterium]|nr:efflux RND transporter permease subunit [Candidatus Saccharibacteria bacterium]
MRRSFTRRKQPGLTLFQRISLFFFDRSRATLLLWLGIFVFGLLSYTTFLRREGFPSIEIPFTVVGGSYVVDDPAKVDTEITKPLSEIALKQPNVKSVQASAQANFFHVFVQYEEGTNADSATENLKKAVQKAKILPPQAEVEFVKPRFGITERGDDVVISYYDPSGTKTTQELARSAEEAVEYLKSKNIEMVQDISIIDPFINGVNPATGQQESRQTSFDRYGKRSGGQSKFFNSVVIGITSKNGTDILKFDDKLQAALVDLNAQPRFKADESVISATFADDIKSQIQELQQALLEGLIAVLIVGAIVIAVRPAIITVLSMLSVLAATVAVLFLIGYTLNTITLFALVLGLALIVDDTIIMVEAIDAQRRRKKDARGTVKEASRRVGRAMTAATSTAVLSFAPLLFVGGILGSFIRAIPVTIILSLIISLLVALIFIPRFARSLMLSEKLMGPGGEREIAQGVEAAIARFLTRPMLWAKGSGKRLLLNGTVALIIGFGFIFAGSWLFSKVTFNIFPPSKDSNQLLVKLDYPPATTIEDAHRIAQDAEKIVTKDLGQTFLLASYYGTGSDRSASIFIDLTPYNERDIRAPQLIEKLESSFKNFKQAQINIAQLDVGPPVADFGVRIRTDDQKGAYKLAGDISKFLDGHKLKRISGEEATIIRTSVANPGAVDRIDGDRYVEVSAEFDSDDITTLVGIVQDDIKKEFNKKKLASYGFKEDVLDFNLGQEEENQESFGTLLIAFPILLAVIYILLAFQFRSLLQPALIFMAIPFSFFGITLGLYVTDNAFSFFTMLGFFALIGLSIKNTILLTDFANQAKASGKGAVDSVVEALHERFRPLIATSLTAVASLVPLAILSPFWEGLVVVLVCGLLSSTFLVITVFPYYYLGAEYLRRRFKRRHFFPWLILNAAVVASLGVSGLGALILPVLLAVNLILFFRKKLQKLIRR